MLLPKSTAAAAPLLLLLAVAAQAAIIPPVAEVATAAAAAVASIPTTAAEVAAAAALNKEPGSVDAPVDGLDGKPHDGPGLRETREKGTGKVGISGGSLHVDIKNPPPHTGDHEIVDIIAPNDGDEPTEAPVEIDEKTGKVKSPPTTPGAPVSDHEHKEYVQPGTDTMKDPPVDAPLHLSPVDPAGEGSSISQPMHSFGLSFLMIIFSEIGDKTFLIAALMAMKHPRIVVFTAALSSLIVMSILSAVLGHAVPTLIPKHLTAFLAGGLFLVFGAKMIKEGLEMEKGTGNVQHEMAEVEAELQEKSRNRASSLSRKLESGTLAPSRSHSLRRNTSSPSLSDSDEDDYASARGTGKGKKMGMLEGVQNLAGLLLSPAWVQTFIMTFLGEWGDRSQIATIAMAAGQDYWYVTIGAISGHTICTGIAVIGGRMLASRISVRNVTLGGAVAFLVFGVLYLAEAIYA
ncbi:hypothetical protein BZA05DRAFT_205605 [Tricharina praecox]|uniref:uncharacterized protein n=1 Tax=Tricharina praecox TaxID=43433 RepID=UPI00221F580C|nr:uncharacterized protein BZA05DRAFT_205605 [Tricharina praecox]KAI5842305.1 hypothetical protein BZA05DRAFT_205605 [Tricharina praecox]